MYQTKVNNKNTFEIDGKDDALYVNAQPIGWDIKTLPDGTFNILTGNRSFNAILEKTDKENKTITLRINNHLYHVQIKEPIDQLLAKMGLNMAATKKAEPIKSPMPGLVLKILVEAGQELKKGDPVLILEAMKMENVFKAPADAKVKAIRTEERKAVEKGEVLIELE